MHPLYSILFAGGVELVLAGHDHSYERFGPMNPAGMADTLGGFTQIVVGTGGTALRGFPALLARGSRYTIQGHHGVLKLTLAAGAYSWNFLPIAGKSYSDSGTSTCH